jgi:hypothetical protein
MSHRMHHETILQSLETLAILSPAIAAVGVRVGQAVKATIARVKAGAW